MQLLPVRSRGGELALGDTSKEPQEPQKVKRKIADCLLAKQRELEKCVAIANQVAS